MLFEKVVVLIKIKKLLNKLLFIILKIKAETLFDNSINNN